MHQAKLCRLSTVSHAAVWYLYGMGNLNCMMILVLTLCNLQWVNIQDTHGYSPTPAPSAPIHVLHLWAPPHHSFQPQAHRALLRNEKRAPNPNSVARLREFTYWPLTMWMTALSIVRKAIRFLNLIYSSLGLNFGLVIWWWLVIRSAISHDAIR